MPPRTKKKVSPTEASFWQALEQTDLTPEFSYDQRTKILTSETYPLTLDDIIYDGKLTEREIGQINTAIQRLHDLNILHGDLSSVNIVVKPLGELGYDIRFIDFGESRWIDTLQKKDIAYFNNFGVSSKISIMH